jgi:hypothetical protein
MHFVAAAAVEVKAVVVVGAGVTPAKADCIVDCSLLLLHYSEAVADM